MMLSRFALAAGIGRPAAAHNPRAAAPLRGTVPSRAGRAAKSTSITGAVTGSAGKSKVDRLGNLSRFAGFAAACAEGAAEIEAAAAEPHAPGLYRPPTRADMHRALAAHPGYASADDAAAAVLGTMAKVQGKSAPPRQAPAARHDLNTAEGLAASAIEAARRAGVIR